MNERPFFTQKVKLLILLALIAVVVGLFVQMLQGYVLALVMAAITAAVLYPAYKWLALQLGARKTFASILIIVGMFLIVVIPILLFLGFLIEEGTRVTQQLAPYAQEIESRVANDTLELPEWLDFAQPYLPSMESLAAEVSRAAGQLGNIVVNNLSNFTQGTLTFFLQLFIFLYALFYYQINGRKNLRVIGQYMPLEKEQYRQMLSKINSVTRATLKGAMFIGFIQGTLVGIGLWVVGVSNPAFWGTIAAIASLIPSVGSAIIWLPFCIWLFIENRYTAGAGLALWGGGVVGSVDNILRPRLVGQDTQMSDLLILLSTLGGIGLFGIAGFILGPVLAGVVISLLEVYREVFVTKK